MKLKIAYFGTPDFSADFLKMIIDDPSLPIEIALVVTQPDQPHGRKKILTPTPVKKRAQEYNIPVWDSELEPSLTRQLANVDLVLLFAYGKIIKKDLLAAPKYGFWNIHPSLLPKYRGTSPMTYPLILGDTVTGVTLMKMDAQLDHGPIIAQRQLAIAPDDRNPDLQQKSIKVVFELFKEAICSFVETSRRDVSTSSSSLGTRNSQAVTFHEQQHDKATYTRFQTKQDGFISLSVLKKALNGEELTDEEMPEIIKDYYDKNPIHQLETRNLLRPQRSSDEVANEMGSFVIRHSSFVIYNVFRGLFPWPGLWTLIKINDEEKRLKITDVELRDGKLILKKVQLEGKNEVDYEQFKKQYNLI